MKRIFLTLLVILIVFLSSCEKDPGSVVPSDTKGSDTAAESEGIKPQSLTVNGTDFREYTLLYTTEEEKAAAESLSGFIGSMFGYQPELMSAVDFHDGHAVYILSNQTSKAPYLNSVSVSGGVMVIDGGPFTDIADSTEMFCTYLSEQKTEVIALDDAWKLEKTSENDGDAVIADQAYLDKLQEKADGMKEAVLSAQSEYPSSGTYYYVSSEGSNDNDGLSPETPFKSYSKAYKKAQSGDTILFRRGDLFRTTIVAKSGVTLSAYGIGDKPTICASVRNYADESIWEQTDKENVWKCTIQLRNVGVVTFDRDPCDQTGNYSSLYAKMQVGAKSYNELEEDMMFYSDLNEHYLYLYSKEGNPGARFSDIEIGTNVFAVSVSDDVTIDNLHITLTGSHGVRTDTQENFVRNLTVRNCVIDWVGGSILDTEVPDVRYGNGIEVWGGCDNVRVYNNWIYQVYDTGITHQIHYQPEASYIQNDIEYHDNLVEYCFYAIEAFNNNNLHSEQKNISVHDNFCRFSGYGFGGQWRWWWTPGYCIHNDSDVCENYVTENNIFENSRYALVTVWGSADAETRQIFKNNTYVQPYGKTFFVHIDQIVPFDRNASANMETILHEKDGNYAYITDEQLFVPKERSAD